MASRMLISRKVATVVLPSIIENSVISSSKRCVGRPDWRSAEATVSTRPSLNWTAGMLTATQMPPCAHIA